jgi:hypothetical protein
MTEFAAKRFAGGIELTALPPHTARPGVAAKGVDHRSAHPALGKGFKLDPAFLVEAVRSVDQAENAILDQVSNVDGVWHRRRHSTGQGLNEGQSSDDSAVLSDGGGNFDAHLRSPQSGSDVFRCLRRVAM